MPIDDDQLRITIDRKRLIEAVEYHAVMQLVGDEVHKQITEDPDMRILVRELVTEAISKMNLQEVVGQAVARALDDMKVSPGGPGLKDSRESRRYVCPHCGRTTYNTNDIERQYCGACLR